MMDRREVLARVAQLMGAGLSASLVSGVLAGCAAAPDVGATPAFLTNDERADLTAMADLILPRTQTPGALDVGVPAFMERMLAGYYGDRERQLVRAGLQRVATDAVASSGRRFAAAPEDVRLALLAGYDREAFTSGGPHFFRLVKELVIVGFCTSEAGATMLMRYEQTPGPFRGDVPVSEIGKAWAL
jgi:hypothetical protein